MKPAPQPVTLDHYMDFLENPHSDNLTNSHLNQIISMHGFQKLHRQPKKRLLETLNSMDLLYPCRSTLKENISACATLTRDDVIKDLDALEWSECSLQSIETVNGAGENSYKEYPKVQKTAQVSQLFCGYPKVKKTRKSFCENSVMVKKTGKRKARMRKRYSLVGAVPSAADWISAPDWVSGPAKESNSSTDCAFWRLPLLPAPADFYGPALFGHENGAAVDLPFWRSTLLDIDSKDNVVRV